MEIEKNLIVFNTRDLYVNRKVVFEEISKRGQGVIKLHNRPKYLIMDLDYLEKFTTMDDYLEAIMKDQGISESETLEFLEKFKKQIDKGIEEFKQKYGSDKQEKLI